MNTPRALTLVALLAAGCGMRVIGDLGAGSSAGDSPAGASGAAGSGGPVSTGGAAGASASTIAGSSSTIPEAPNGGTLASSGGAITSGAGASATGGAGAGSVAGAGGAAGVTASAAGAGGQGDADTAAGAGGQADTLPPLLTAVPVAHLSLDDCAGPVIDSASSETGVRFNVACTDGRAGKAASFSADVSDMGPRRIELTDEPRFWFTQQLTVAAWVRPEPGPLIQAIVAKWYDYDMFQLAVRYVTDGEGKLSPRFAFTIAEPDGEWGRPAEVVSPVEVELQQWAHVAGVYRWSPDGQVGHVTLYVNGEPVAETSTKVGNPGLQQSSRPIMIGYADDGAQFVGAIDEVRLYDVALGPELAWLFREPTHP
jgi:hypothetical protein